MSLERKDLRVYLDPDVHTGLGLLADQARIDLRELAEQIIRDFVVDRIHAASVLADKAARAGINRIAPVSSGERRKAKG